jgi:hypothetical protein
MKLFACIYLEVMLKPSLCLIRDNEKKTYLRWKWPRGMNYLFSLKHWSRGFEFHWRHVYVRLFCDCAILYVGSGIAKGWYPVQGVLPTVHKIKKLKKVAKDPTKGRRATKT